MKTSRQLLATLGFAAIAAHCLDARADLIFSNFNESTFWVGGVYSANDQPAVEYEQAVMYLPTVSCLLTGLEVAASASDNAAGMVPPVPPGTPFGNSAQVAVYADDVGWPGALLEVADAPDSMGYWHPGLPVPQPFITARFSGTTLLQAGQRYWISVIETEESAILWWFSSPMVPTARVYREVGGKWDASAFARGGLRVYGTPIPDCDADVNGDGDVNADDLTTVILSWGACPTPPEPCPGDVDDSGEVDADDLVAVILSWGPCK